MAVSPPTRINRKRRDRLPDLDVILDDSPGVPADLTSTTVRFIMRAIGSTVPKVAATANIIGAPTNGAVRYSWATNDLDTPGKYRGEFEVTYSGGKTRTFPAEGYIAIEVWDDLDTPP